MLFLSFSLGPGGLVHSSVCFFSFFLLFVLKLPISLLVISHSLLETIFFPPSPLFFFFKVLASVFCKLMRKLYALAIFNDMEKLSHTHLHVTDAGIRHLSLSICPICIMFLQQSPSNVHLQFVLFLLCISSMCLRWQTWTVKHCWQQLLTHADGFSAFYKLSLLENNALGGLRQVKKPACFSS